MLFLFLQYSKIRQEFSIEEKRREEAKKGRN
jgi:hypothetical protein